MMRKVASYENDIIVEVNSSMTGIDSLPLLIDLLISIIYRIRSSDVWQTERPSCNKNCILTWLE